MFTVVNFHLHIYNYIYRDILLHCTPVTVKINRHGSRESEHPGIGLMAANIVSINMIENAPPKIEYRHSTCEMIIGEPVTFMIATI
jgi:hypothetical protein